MDYSHVFCVETIGGATFADMVVNFGFVAQHLVVTHVAGSGTVEISIAQDFNAAHGKVDPASVKYPTEMRWDNSDTGFSKCHLKGAGGTVLVRAWR